MNGFATALATLLLAGTFTAPAAAEFVFFDDFDGDALLPHWNQPPPSYWEYNVSNSMLNVTGLFVPSNPKSPSNFASMNTAFAPQTDFQVDAWMGWEAGQAPHRLELRMFAGPGQGAIIASMGYRFEAAFGPIPLIYGSTGSGQTFNIPAPDPGIHHFRISRVAGQFKFLFNGSQLATFSDTSGFSTTGLGFFFLGPYPGQLGAFHIDSVIVVPSPGMVVVIPAALVFASANRRRR